MTTNESVSAIKLVRKSAFRRDAFSSIDPEAEKVIESAKPDQILALTITKNSLLKVAQARIFDKNLFESILADN